MSFPQNSLQFPNSLLFPPPVEGIAPLVEVTVDLSLHHLALSCDELTLSVCGTSDEAALSLTFYDIRTFLNKVAMFACNFVLVSWHASWVIYLKSHKIKWSHNKTLLTPSFKINLILFIYFLYIFLNTFKSLPNAPTVTLWPFDIVILCLGVFWFFFSDKAEEVTFYVSVTTRSPWHSGAGPEVESCSGIHAGCLLVRRQHADSGCCWRRQTAGWAASLQWHHVQCVRLMRLKHKCWACLQSIYLLCFGGN